MARLKKNIRILVVAFACVALPVSALGDESISLRVESVRQRTLVWCWVAVAQMIISYYNNGDRPRQCEIMEWGYRLPTDYCCDSENRCATTGSLQQITRAIEHYSDHQSIVRGPPATVRGIYRALNRDRVIVAAISSGMGAGHVVVVRGLRLRNGRYELLVNDPMSKYASVVDLEQFSTVWQQSIVVKGRTDTADDDD